MSSKARTPGSPVEHVTPHWVLNPAGKQITLPLGSELHGVFEAEARDGYLRAVVSQDNGYWHVSVSFKPKGDALLRCPSWDELKSAKYELVPMDVDMQLNFPRSDRPYVNVSKTCLHLWESNAGTEYP